MVKKGRKGNRRGVSRAGFVHGDVDAGGSGPVKGGAPVEVRRKGEPVEGIDVDYRKLGPVQAHKVTKEELRKRRTASVHMMSYAPLPMAGFGPSPWPLADVPPTERDIDCSQIQFLMRAVRPGKEGCLYMGRFFERNDFYKIKLGKKEDGDYEFLAQNWGEPQLNCLGSCVMLRVGSRIYNISRLLLMDVTKVPQSLSFQPEFSIRSEILDCHTGLSSISLDFPFFWKSETPLECYDLNVESAVLNEDIYSLQSSVIRMPRCFRTDERRWVKCYPEPPAELFECVVTPKMIPQPSKDRILVHLTTFDYSVSYLYAWTPEPQNSWELITQDISVDIWERCHPNLVGDVLYFYYTDSPPYFSAFDLTTKKWLTINWAAQFPPDAAGNTPDFMFYLGNRLLCLAKTYPVDIFNTDGKIDIFWGARVTFSVFRFLPTSTPQDGPLVIFTHLFTKSLACPDIRETADFISLVQDEVK